ncbi:hypothetical protein N0B51_08990 [Tsuneonella sp. YG55]|uniref:17 kDa surface antigen n=1 Tax=Tsuneonella litorea TaxID=2976475 RepID=A0A9X2W1L6_9SPHN|nr:hypothetical protein [Tsuneonella litorea]MCT2559116.1 hypothetical protein [Tsuneonella litorea]
MAHSLRFASAAAFAACVSMAAAPLAGAEMPVPAAPLAVTATGAFEPDNVNAQNHRRWYRRDRVDAGDVIGAVVVLGAIAAVASAASNASRRDRDYRYPQRYPYPDRDYRYDYRSRADEGRFGDSRGLDRAVDMCAREVERNARIESIDGANRTGAGWDVTGRLRTGDAFRCSIGNDGRIEGLEYGGPADLGRDPIGSAEPAAGQWDEGRYAAARAKRDGAPDYPGGPLPAEDQPGANDDRYQTAEAPDFPG